MTPNWRSSLIAVALCGALVPVALIAQDALPAYLKDRGPGIRTSIFGTYVRRGELLVSPFYEYYWDNNAEYKPAELGFGLERDFRGKFRAHEGLLFVSYGFTDWLALELEGAVIEATLEKSPSDPSSMPPELKQSGIGDLQAQLDFRLRKETAERPEVFSYFEVVFPNTHDKRLIGTHDWEFKGGGGLTRGYRWGTLTGRVAIAYEEGSIAPGEMAVEYLKRVSRAWRLYAGVEGTQDEVELIGEAQWHVTDRLYFRFNSALGISSKATDWAPDVGFVFSTRLRR